MSALPQDASAESQRARLLNRLRKGPLTTIEARRELDVMMPAARIFELRHRHGYEIGTDMVLAETTPGRWHLVGQYALMGEAQREVDFAAERRQTV